MLCEARRCSKSAGVNREVIEKVFKQVVEQVIEKFEKFEKFFRRTKMSRKLFAKFGKSASEHSVSVEEEHTPYIWDQGIFAK